MDDHAYRQYWFNDYTEIEFSGGTAICNKRGGVEITVPGGYYGDDVEAYVELEEMECLYRMARAMKEYHQAAEGEA